MSEKQIPKSKLPPSTSPDSMVRAGSVAGVRDYVRVRRGDRAPERTSIPRSASSAARAPRPIIPTTSSPKEIARLLSDAGLSRDLRRRAGHHGSGQQGRVLRQIAQRRAEHPAAARAAHQPYQDVSQTFQHFFARKVMFVKFASRLRGDARRLRHAGRTDGGADAGADRQDAHDSHHPGAASLTGAACSTGSGTRWSAKA